MQDRPAGQPPEPTEADWLRLVEKSLAGRPLSTLRTEIEAGVVVDPLRPAGATRPLRLRRAGPWQKLQRLDDLAGEVVAEALAAGADGFELILEGTVPAYRGGVDIARLDEALTMLPIDRCRLRLASGSAAPEVEAALERAAARSRLDPALLNVAFGFDPIGAGADRKIDRDALGQLPPRVGHLSSRGWRGPFLTADGRIVHGAGGAASTELGFALSAFRAYLERLLDGGIPDDAAVAAIDVALAADEDQFVTIAKFRAMRLLQARLLAAARLPAAPLVLHGETGWRQLAAEDARSNLIRTSIAALAAGIGGVDSLTVLPFTAGLAEAGREAGRLTLTTQAVLIAEAHLARVADPSAGSGAIERLTLDLAEAGWATFQQVEREGGLLRALAGGSIGERITTEAAQRRAAFATGERCIVGVTLFRADGQPAASPVSSAVQLDAFSPRRDAAPFERGLS